MFPVRERERVQFQAATSIYFISLCGLIIIYLVHSQIQSFYLSLHHLNKWRNNVNNYVAGPVLYC